MGTEKTPVPVPSEKGRTRVRHANPLQDFGSNSESSEELPDSSQSGGPTPFLDASGGTGDPEGEPAVDRMERARANVEEHMAAFRNATTNDERDRALFSARVAQLGVDEFYRKVTPAQETDTEHSTEGGDEAPNVEVATVDTVPDLEEGTAETAETVPDLEEAPPKRHRKKRRKKKKRTRRKKPLTIPEIVAEDRAPDDEDASLSLHADQGPELGLSTLKRSVAEFVLAVREKEELRDELGVKKLKDAKDKTPEQKRRIEGVRTRKVEAEKAYVRCWHAVTAYLAEAPNPDLLDEIAEIDAIVLEEKARDAGETGAHLEDSRQAAAGRAMDLGIVAETLVLGEERFARLKRSMQTIHEAGVGSRNKSVGFSLSVKFGLSKASSISAKAGVGYSGSVNIQDDRRLRVSHSLDLSVGVSAELAGVLSAGVSGDLARSRTEVFMDVDHWAAVMALRLETIAEELLELDDIQQVVEDEYDDDTAEVLLQNTRLAQDPTTSVSTTSLTGTLEANALGFGAKGTLGKKWMTFEKGDKKKQGTSRAASVTIGIGNGSITFTHTKIRRHAIPDNNGDYWNIKLTLKGKAAAGMAGATEDPVYEEWEQDMREAFDVAPQPEPSGAGDAVSVDGVGAGLPEVGDAVDAGHIGGIAKSISGTLAKSLVSLEATLPVDISASVVASASGSVEWNFIRTNQASGKEGYTLQYRRASATAGISGSGSLPLASVGIADVSLGVSASKSTMVMLNEKLGKETLTYLLTVFNGLSVPDSRDTRLDREGESTRWEEYVDLHAKEVWAALGLMQKEKGAVGEVRAKLDEVDDPIRPDGVSRTDWKPVRAAGKKAKKRGERLLDRVQGLDATARAPDEDDGWEAARKALTRYFAAVGDFDKAVAALEWTDR